MEYQYHELSYMKASFEHTSKGRYREFAVRMAHY